METAHLIAGQCLPLGQQDALSSTQVLAQQWLSTDSSHRQAAIKLHTTVITTCLQDIAAQQQSFKAQAPFHADQEQQTVIHGVCFSPDGSSIAAYSSDTLYIAVAALQPAQRVGQLQPVASLAGITAVHWCPDAAVLAVICRQQPGVCLAILQQQQQQQPGMQSVLQLLPGPSDERAAAARCATWLPRSSGCSYCDNRVGLLVAWSSDVLLYTWQAKQGGAVWQQFTTRQILAGWPGPVRALAAAAAAQPSSTSGSHVILGTVDAQLSLGSGSSHSGSSTALMQGASAGPATTDHQQAFASGSTNATATAAACEPMIELKAAAPAPAAPWPGASGLLVSGGAGDPPGAAATGGLLGGLMNIASLQHAAGSSSSTTTTTTNTVIDAAAAADAHASMQMNSACLCMLQISLTDNSRGSQRSGGGGSSSSNVTSRDAAVPFISVLPLPHVPLPNLLALQQGVAVVASSKGTPVVAVCSFGAATGLQLLQAVLLPLPLADPAFKTARLRGLLLTQSAAAAAAAGAAAVQPMSCVSSSNTTPAEDKVLLLPDLVALLACGQQDATHAAGFAVFGSKRNQAAAELCLVKYQFPSLQQQADDGMAAARPPTLQLEQQQQQQQQQQDLGVKQCTPTHLALQQQQQDPVVVALERLQSSLEKRLDAITDMLGRLVQRIERLESAAAADSVARSSQ